MRWFEASPHRATSKGQSFISRTAPFPEAALLPTPIHGQDTPGYKAARNRPLTRSQKLSNKALAAVRAPVEHGFAHLKNWRVLGKVRTDPKWATALVRALLVLTNREVDR
jgi:DDE superfamily endonuclease